MKKIIVLVLVAVATGFTAVAQTNNATQTQLQALVQKIEDKLQAGKNTEADLTGELKSFDGLVAAQNGAKTDEVAAHFKIDEKAAYRALRRAYSPRRATS